MKRIWHPWTMWECYRSGLYETACGYSKEQAVRMYAEFFRDSERFYRVGRAVTTEWKYSCEHFLTNDHINRLAWIGQASMCYATGVPAVFRGGFHHLNAEEQKQANRVAKRVLGEWCDKQCANISTGGANKDTPMVYQMRFLFD
jgi:hypothetical protein